MAYIVDPELAAVQDSLPRADLSDLARSREVSRRFLEQVRPYESKRELSVREIRTADGVGGRVMVAAEHDGPFPALIYLRSSGYTLGSINAVDNSARRIADEIDVTVITVDFRLAPENPYPAALDDGYAVLEWVAKTDDEAIDPGRIVVLGDSAGGGIAAALAMRARDSDGPAISAMLLDAPTIDDRCDTPSMREFTDTPMWRGPDTPIAWRAYLGQIERGSTNVPIYAAPARASVNELRGLPPAWVTTYQLDPTRDEVLQFANRLAQADVPTELHLYPSAFHLAHTIPGTTIGRRMLADKYAAIRRMTR